MINHKQGFNRNKKILIFYASISFAFVTKMSNPYEMSNLL